MKLDRHRVKLTLRAVSTSTTRFHFLTFHTVLANSFGSLVDIL